MNDNNDTSNATPPVETPAPQPAPSSPFATTPPEELPVTPPAAFPSQPPKKSRKGLIITLVIVLVVLIAGALAYFLFLKPKDSATSQTPTTNTQSETTDYAQTIIDTIKSALNTELASTYPSLEVKDSNYASSYKVSGVAYSVSGDFGKNIMINPTPGENYEATTATAVSKVVRDAISSDTSLTKTEKEDPFDDTSVFTTYTNNNVTCSVKYDTQPLYVYCANIADYTKAAATITPFADAYLASDEGKKYVAQYGTEDLALAVPKITEKSDGYKNATIGAMNASLLFYTDANGTWQYFISTQDSLLCSAYNTHDLQKAFEGDSCYDDANPTGDAMKAVIVKG